MIQAHPDGATLAVRAQPNAKKSAVLGRHGEAIKIAITAPPEDGRANAALTEYLKTWLGVKRSQVVLLSGEKSRDKVFLIRGLTPAELTERVG
ncbi:MAG: DUF167 domain-containing protein [Fimbriiglobus sp.]|nr:DUF167 domain-containing protein [Fimbriiglobus sp.]